jgi:hypothetical protein
MRLTPFGRLLRQFSHEATESIRFLICAKPSSGLFELLGLALVLNLRLSFSLLASFAHGVLQLRGGRYVRGNVSWTIEKSQIKSSENQDNANIYYQPLPESISEERHVYTDDNGCHRQHVKRDSYLPAHSQYPFRLRHLSAFVPARGPGQLNIPPKTGNREGQAVENHQYRAEQHQRAQILARGDGADGQSRHRGAKQRRRDHEADPHRLIADGDQVNRQGSGGKTVAKATHAVEQRDVAGMVRFPLSPS